MRYGYSKKIDLPFIEVVAKMKDALASEGFGVLTEIDVKATMKKKLDIEYDNYTILGACNPTFAHQALQMEKEIGLLLPCNVIVYEDSDGIHVSAIVPSVAMSMVENPSLSVLAEEAGERLKRTIDSL